MNKTIFRVLAALILTPGLILYPRTHTNVSTATVKAPTYLQGASRGKPTRGLVCARGVKISKGHGVLVDITLAVSEAEDTGEISRDALVRQGLTPMPELAPSGLRWARFFDHDHKNNLVEQVYNPDGQNFADSADAAANAAGQTWADVPTATFADAVLGIRSRRV
ncbi:MAG: hypothetical protein ACRD9S_23590 [Pyrinomonadaceae bacterium]